MAYNNSFINEMCKKYSIQKTYNKQTIVIIVLDITFSAFCRVVTAKYDHRQHFLQYIHPLRAVWCQPVHRPAPEWLSVTGLSLFFVISTVSLRGFRATDVQLFAFPTDCIDLHDSELHPYIRPLLQKLYAISWWGTISRISPKVAKLTYAG